jgi:glycosyltransferase involved in cell wall biosynthesis
VQAKKLAVIANGIDVAQFESARPAADLENIKRGNLAVGLVGRLIHGKGHRELFEAATNILREFPNTTFFIVGDGFLRQRLETLACELNIARNVFFLGKRTDMPQVYATLDLVVLPSTAEGTPVSVLEALAAKKAVIASNVGGIPEIILDNTTGRLIEPGDSHALQGAVLGLLGNADLRRFFGGRGNALVWEKYSAAQMAGKYLAEYRKLTNNAGTPPMLPHNPQDPGEQLELKLP